VGLYRKPRKSAAHRFPNSLRESARVPSSAAFVDVAQGLDEEERIASRDGRQRPRQLFVVISGFGDVRGDVVLVETAQREPIGGAVAVKVGEHGRQQMSAIQVGTTVR